MSDSGSVGDCPFTHTAGMRLFAKGIDFSYVPCSKEQKPDWLLAPPHNGTMPCLTYFTCSCGTDGSEGEEEDRERVVISDSVLICKHIDEVMTTEQIGGDKCSPALREEAWNIVDNLGFFRAFAMFMKSDPSNRAERKAALHERCAYLESLLEQQDYPCICPSAIGSPPRYFLKRGFSQVDCTLAPQLFMCQAVLQHFTGQPFQSLLVVPPAVSPATEDSPSSAAPGDVAGDTAGYSSLTRLTQRARLKCYIMCMLGGEEVFSSTLKYDAASAIAGWAAAGVEPF